MEAMWAAAGGGTSEGAAAGGGAAGVAEGAESESAAGAEEEDEDYLAQMEAMWANVPMVEAPPPSPSPTPPLPPPLPPQSKGAEETAGKWRRLTMRLRCRVMRRRRGSRGTRRNSLTNTFMTSMSRTFTSVRVGLDIECMTSDHRSEIP